MIHGKPGVGKTALMTAWCCERMTKTARDFVVPARHEITQLNKSGFKLSLPDKHLVYADYDIIARVEGYSPRASYTADGYRVGLPAEGFDAQFFVPYSLLAFNEGQKYWNSRKSGNDGLPDNVSRFFELHRHDDLDIIMDCQRPGLIDRNIRDLCKRFVEVLSMRFDYDRYGAIAGVTWLCLEHEDVYELESYFSTGKKSESGHRTKYYHEGNIFAAYNSKNYKSVFYKDRYKQDFDMVLCTDVKQREKKQLTLESIREFNENHKYIKEKAAR